MNYNSYDNNVMTRLWFRLTRWHTLAIIDDNILSTGNVLDYGCADGGLLLELSRKYQRANFYGYDLNVESLRNLETYSSHIPNVNIFWTDPAVQSNIKFNLVILSQVIEHIPNPSLYLRTLKTILAKDGVVIITTPNLSGVAAKIHGNNWSGYADPTHVSLKTKEQWNRTLEDAGFNIERSLSSCRVDLFRGRLAILNNVSKLFNLVFGYVDWSFGESVCIIATAKSEDKPS